MARPALYPLRPLGRGTVEVESFTGYLGRLAQEHQVFVGTLVTRHVLERAGWRAGVAPRGGIDLRNARDQLREDAGSLDGSGPRSAGWVAALEGLAGVEGLATLTCASWTDVLAARRLLRKEAAYCPRCLQDDLDRDHGPYERLVWRLQAVEACDRHALTLRGSCIHCGRMRPPLAWRSRPGYCPWCRRWVGSERGEGPASPWQLQVANLVGQALAAPRERFERDDLLRSLDVAAQHLGDGTRAGLARSLGLRSKSTVTEWFTTGTAPSLEVMARAAALLGCPLEDLLTGRAVPRGGTTTIQAPARRAHRQHDWVMVASRLDAMLNEVAPPSVDEAMRRLEIDESTVRRRFPDQLRRLAAGARAARERRKVERRDDLVGIVVAACEEMRARGIYPGRRRIERLLPPGVSVREPTLRATWVAHRGDR